MLPDVEIFICETEDKIKAFAESDNGYRWKSHKVIIVMTPDGLEISSDEFTQKRIKEVTKHLLA